MHRRLRRNLKPGRRGARIGPGHVHTTKGFVHESLVRLPRAGRAVSPHGGGAGHDRDSRAVPAQDTAALTPGTGVTLSLEEALQQARANSPTYRQTLNDAGPAKWGVRNAYGSLLPSVNVALGSGLHRLGASRTSAAASSGRPRRSSPPATASACSGSSTAGRSPRRREQKALQRATDEDISGPASTLRAEIETQYLTTLQATRRWRWPGSR